ncbi:MAG: ribokinase [Methylococcales bacterium]|nr:ribokinase [Methylococcales bacterium]
MRIFVLGSYVNANCLCVENLPAAGESLSAQAMWTEHGGKGLNLAVGIHRLGIHVDTLMSVGMDSAADSLLKFLKAEGVDTRWVIRKSEQSGFGVGFIAPGGENFLAVYPGANFLLDASHVAQTAVAIGAADLVCAQFEIQETPILAAFSHARKLGIRTLLNPSPWRAPGMELLALTNILVANETEAASLFGLSAGADLSPEYWVSGLPAWAERSAWRGELLVVTLGEQGCVALNHRTVIYQPAWVVASVDATGAGDAFCAGLATALVQGDSLPDALILASACGAWVAAHRGVLQALPTLTEITRFVGT